MEEDMNLGEKLVEQTEDKVIYKILLMIEESKKNSESLEQLEEKIKALLEK